MGNTLFLSESTGLVIQDSQHRLSQDYAKLINSHPVLDAVVEEELAKDLYDNNNPAAAQKLVFSNLRGVVYVARNYMGYSLPLMDLVQEGAIGLMKAVRQFNPYKKVRLFAWALPWIKSEIQQYVVRNWKMVKAATTDARQKLFFNLRKLKNEALPLGENIKHIAQALGVSEKDVREMDGYMNKTDTDVDTAINMHSPDAPDLALEYKEDQQKMQLALNMLQELPARELKVIQARYVNEPTATLHQLSLELNVSVERVRQLEKQGLQRLQKSLMLSYAPSH